MNYRLELLDEEEFADLVNAVCQELLGIGVVSFTKGKDGGKDGKFEGTAECYPSSQKPWSGKFIIQAKHTGNPVASCSDHDFKKVIEKEIPKIKKLKSSDNIDNYMLFTNRKYTGVKGEEIQKKISTETGVQNSVIIGKETINDQYLKPCQDIVRLYGLNKLHIPFDFSDEEIKNIILTFKKQLPRMKDELESKVKEIKHDFKYLNKEVKNKKNKLGQEYWDDVVLADSLPYFDKIKCFLEDPRNEELKGYYYDTVAELKNKITIRRENFSCFEEIFEYIYNHIHDGESALKGGKRHAWHFLHYMYSVCDIGKKE